MTVKRSQNETKSKSKLQQPDYWSKCFFYFFSNQVENLKFIFWDFYFLFFLFFLVPPAAAGDLEILRRSIIIKKKLIVEMLRIITEWGERQLTNKKNVSHPILDLKKSE